MGTDGRPRGRAAGFTLIELLVGLAILGLLAAMLVAGLGTSGLMAARSRTAADALEPVAAAQMVLRGRIERMRALPRLDGPDVVDVDGGPHALVFVGAPPDRDLPDALFRYRLAMASDGDVLLTAAPVLAFGADGAMGPRRAWSAIRIAQGARALSIAYFGADPLNGGGRWQDRWTNRPQPPDLVRVRIAFSPGDGRHWPDLVARPRATVNSACRIDARSGRCGDDA